MQIRQYATWSNVSLKRQSGEGGVGGRSRAKWSRLQWVRVPDLPKIPPFESSAFGKPRHVRLLAGEKPRCLPQAAVDQAAVSDLSDEDGGAIDDHHVAGVLYADAYRFVRRINGAAGVGRAGGKADIARSFGEGVVIYRQLPGQSVEVSLVKVRIFVVFALM